MTSLSQGVCKQQTGYPYLLWAVQAHPHLPVLATSGIEPTIKIWSPGEERIPNLLELVQAMKRNQVPSQLTPLDALSRIRSACGCPYANMNAWVSVVQRTGALCCCCIAL